MQAPPVEPTAGEEMLLTVVVCCHNSAADRLRRTLLGLAAQDLAHGLWETLLVDNGSKSAPLWDAAPANTRVLGEARIGLTFARQRGMLNARGRFVVLVDDDNVLAPDYLRQVVRLFEAHPGVGALGGRSLPEFESPPQPWHHEFFNLLALRDCGEKPLISADLRPPGPAHNLYPQCAPIGAGMGLRREAVTAWLAAADSGKLSDRRGQELCSAGDNDLVFSVLKSGWKVAYFPELSLTHLIPGQRLEAEYLERLNYGIQKSWMQVLSLHQASPWRTIAPWSVPLRQLKAWVFYQAWRSAAARIRWRGACGHFAGRVAGGLCGQ